jgi:hypothetical protein
MGYKFTNEVTDTEGNITVVEVGEVPFWPLDPSQVAVVLLICKGVLTLDEGVNITHLPAEHLVNEAEAWAVASGAV